MHCSLPMMPKNITTREKTQVLGIKATSVPTHMQELAQGIRIMDTNHVWHQRVCKGGGLAAPDGPATRGSRQSTKIVKCEGPRDPGAMFGQMPTGGSGCTVSYNARRGARLTLILVSFFGTVACPGSYVSRSRARRELHVAFRTEQMSRHPRVHGR